MKVKVENSNFEIDNDISRIDVEAVWYWLSHRSTWAIGRSRDKVERQMKQSWMCFAVYDMDGSRGGLGKTIGYARVISDGEDHAYVSDVFVNEEYRGKGLGKALLNHVFNEGGRADFKWLLNTDTPDLYRPFGFTDKVVKRFPMMRWPASVNISGN